ncbi:MAG: hypothetical protein JWM93_3372 [Frankiales bacterium]|nr:hypothetical protein [Frankiales bacterium]
MKPSRFSVLAPTALAVGIAVYFLLRVFYSDLPTLPRTAPATFAFLALAEIGVALSLRPRLERRPGTTPVQPLLAARIAALAKASAVAAAIGIGAYGGLLAYVLPQLSKRGPAADAIVGGIGVGVSVLLLVGALLLERSCRLPDAPDESADADEPPYDPYAHR